MSVQITDCTIRDGGYLFNKNSDPDFIKGIMKGLADAGIDFVETGFLVLVLLLKDSSTIHTFHPGNALR